MFELRRLDVWPTGDLGVRKGFGVAFSIPMPSAKELEPLGDRFRPYRSAVAWYCWRSRRAAQRGARALSRWDAAAKAKSPASKKKAPAAKKKASAAKTKSSATKKKSSATKKKSRARSG